MSDKEAFTCPFCGAPYRTLIPAGAVQVNCAFCKSIILVPPRLGGTVQRCPNHPDVLAVGLCNDCGKSYCDRCLYIHKVEQGVLHLCSVCYKRRQGNPIVWRMILLVMIVIFGMLSLVPNIQVSVPSLLTTLILIASLVWGFLKPKEKPLNVHDSRQI